MQLSTFLEVFVHILFLQHQRSFSAMSVSSRLHELISFRAEKHQPSTLSHVHDFLLVLETKKSLKAGGVWALVYPQ